MYSMLQEVYKHVNCNKNSVTPHRALDRLLHGQMKLEIGIETSFINLDIKKNLIMYLDNMSAPENHSGHLFYI